MAKLFKKTLIQTNAGSDTSLQDVCQTLYDCAGGLTGWTRTANFNIAATNNYFELASTTSDLTVLVAVCSNANPIHNNNRAYAPDAMNGIWVGFCPEGQDGATVFTSPYAGTAYTGGSARWGAGGDGDLLGGLVKIANMETSYQGLLRCGMIEAEDMLVIFSQKATDYLASLCMVGDIIDGVITANKEGGTKHFGICATGQTACRFNAGVHQVPSAASYFLGQGASKETPCFHYDPLSLGAWLRIRSQANEWTGSNAARYGFGNGTEGFVDVVLEDQSVTGKMIGVLRQIRRGPQRTTWSSLQDIANVDLAFAVSYSFSSAGDTFYCVNDDLL